LSDNFGRGRRAGTDIPGGQRTFRMLTGNANPNLDSAALQQSLIAANEQDARRILGQAFDTIGVERPFEREVAELAASKAYQTADPAAQKKLMDAAIGRMETKKDYLVNLLRGADLQFARNNTGIFDTAGWTNLNRYESGLNRVLENSKVVASRLDEASQPFVAGQLADGMMSIADAAEALKFDPDNFTAMFQQRFGKDPSAYAVSERLLQDLKTMSKPTRLGEPEGAVLSAIDNFTNAFKVSALASPAFHFRNNYSGAVSAANHGAFNPLDWYANLRASHGNYTLIGNRLKNAPGFENMTHAQRVDKYKDLMGAHQIGGGVVSDDITRLPEQEIRGSYIGATNEPNVLESLGTGLWDSSRGWREYRNNFFSMRGVGIFGNAPTQNRNPLLMANDAMGRQVEDALRGGVFLNQLRKGVNPGEAADLVRMSQVDYRPQAFSATERNFFKRVLPFYSFAKGILPSINDSLLYRPGGLQGQAVRAVTRGTQPTEDNFIPEHMRQSAAIPLPADLPGILGGSSRPGLQRYLTNLDLPWESTFQMFAPGVGATMSARVGDSLRKTGSNILGNTNPLLKAPLEYIFNRQMYTGRDLTDLYSVLERDMGEIGRPAEQVIANLPFGSRGLGLYRQLTDTRLDPTDRYAKAFFNQVFGAKLTDIDEERSKQQAARAMLNTMLQTTPGVRTYENVTVPEEALMAMPDDQRRMYLLYRVIQSEAAKRARQRKKAQEMLTGPTI
jgi:AraC-like DNA-binding protein